MIATQMRPAGAGVALEEKPPAGQSPLPAELGAELVALREQNAVLEEALARVGERIEEVSIEQDATAVVSSAGKLNSQGEWEPPEVTFSQTAGFTVNVNSEGVPYLTILSDFGIEGEGAYYNTAGAAAGQAASLSFNSAAEPVLTLIGGQE